MRAKDYLEETWEALDANRGRSLLTILGIVIGIAAVIAMTGLIGGIRESIMQSMGGNRARIVDIGLFTTSFKEQDRQALLDELPEYEAASLMAFGMEPIGTTSGGKGPLLDITGVQPSYFDIADAKVVQGRRFTRSEEAEAATVALLSRTAATQYFGPEADDAVGREIRIGTSAFTVIGIFDADGAGAAPKALVPLSSCLRTVKGASAPNSLIALAHEGVDVEDLTKRTETWVAQRFNLKEDDGSFMVFATQSAIKAVSSAMLSFQVLMTSVASISLLVGGIGIMNMMLTNVTERIREIGLRKALGARSSDITKQFLLESIMLCVAGGIIGIIFGYLGAFGIARLASSALASEGFTAFAPAIDAKAVLGATGICILIGVVFGYYPARRAARLNPIEALRYQ